MKLAHVFVEHPSMHLDYTFTYLCDGFSVCRGMRVRVPFHTTSIIGFVDHVEDVSADKLEEFNYEIKSIQAVIDEEPLLNEELFSLAKWMAHTCVAPRISCFQCILPAKLRPSSTHGHVKMVSWVRFVKEKENLSTKQRIALDAMKLEKEMLRTTFYQLYKSAGKKLIEFGCLEVFEKEARASLVSSIPMDNEKVLSEEQHKAMSTLTQLTHHEVVLLHGATGSGKTEVFLQLAQTIIKKGKQVVFLVPEISLTPQMMQRVQARFGEAVAIYHSALNEQEKYEQYQLVKQHKVQIVVGTRSAIFMPFDNLGLLILDEEHDTSYKQDVTPRYHCRDIAIQRGKNHDALVVLASATPSLETYARAHKGTYRLLSMPSRINQNFPDVNVIEMRKALKNGQNYILSNPLMDAMYERLQKKEQILLLLNRRGYTPILRCISCGFVQMCPHCEVAMSYHKDDKHLKCHTCGHVMPVPTHCPTCGSDTWRYLGMGTQKLEEFIQLKFPQARILRMDADTTGKKHAHEHILRDFGEHKADILVGTQMIAKGLDFENVTLVGIVNGDALLNRSDYRSAELTYDMLEQACGRSGRGSKKGEVYIQAYDTTHYAIRCAAHHDYISFFKQEMNYRHLASYPPYTYLASIVFAHIKEAYVMQESERAMHVLADKKECKVLGPATLTKRKDEIRMRILLKGKNQEALLAYVWEVYQQYLDHKGKARMEIDMAPTNLD